MADDFLTVDVSDFEGFAQLLERFPLEVQDKMLKKATGAGASVLQVAIINAAPERVGEHTTGSNALPPGYVKADIRVAPLKTGRGWLIGPSPVTAYVVRWLERGHLLIKGGKRGGPRSARVNVGGKVIGHVPAHPFIRPAFDAHWREAVTALSQQLGAEMAKYWKDTLRKLKLDA